MRELSPWLHITALTAEGTLRTVPAHSCLAAMCRVLVLLLRETEQEKHTDRVKVSVLIYVQLQFVWLCSCNASYYSQPDIKEELEGWNLQVRKW